MAPAKLRGKTKKVVVGVIKMNLLAGKATPAPPVGPAVATKGDKESIMAQRFCKEYNAQTADKTGVAKGSKDPKKVKVGKIKVDQLRKIAEEKLPDLNCTSIVSAMRTIAGTAANMGIDIDPPILEPKKKVALW